MANKRLGSHSSHNYQVAEKITEAKQLNWSDSGKIFFVHTETGQGTYVINLPQLSEEICGWQAKFVMTAVGDSVEILAYGVPAGGGSGTDENKVMHAEVSATPAQSSDRDGVQFHASATNIGISFQIHTDGTYWYSMGIGGQLNDIAKVG